MNIPNIQTVMPGDQYSGPDPEGALTRDEFVALLEDLVYFAGLDLAVTRESGTILAVTDESARLVEHITRQGVSSGQDAHISRGPH
jgi:putative flavoprotein involved in K+ transport